jgi:hypothetical protein
MSPCDYTPAAGLKLERGQFLQQVFTTTLGGSRLSSGPQGVRAILGRGLLALCFLAGTSGVLAQGILAPPPEDYEKPAASQSLTTIQNGGIPPEVSTGLPPAGPVQLGPVDFHPHFLYQYIYGDGIPSAPTNRVKTSIQQISPGLTLLWGSHWTLDYTPTVRLYSNRQLGDGTDESVSLMGGASYQDWSFKLSQIYGSSDAVLLQTETPTAQQTFATSFTVNRQLGNWLSAEMDLNQTLTSSSAAGLSQDAHEWTISPALNCQFTPQFGIGVNATAGYDQITPGSNETFEQVGGRMNWMPGKKLNFTASAGLEVRQLLGEQLISPIFNATLTYRPMEQTAASVSASRTVTPALFEDEVTVTTSLSATLRQRFLKRFTLEATGGYTTSPFVGFEAFSNSNVTDFNGIPLTSVSEVSREDYYRFARVSLSCPFLKKGNASVFYQGSDTTSGLSAVALTSTQVGIQLGYRF